MNLYSSEVSSKERCLGRNLCPCHNFRSFEWNHASMVHCDVSLGSTVRRRSHLSEWEEPTSLLQTMVHHMSTSV